MKEKCILVDIDGTVAQMHDRGPFDWKKVGNDLPRKAVVNIVYLLNLHYKVIFFSGRDSICRKQTEQWIKEHIYGEPNTSLDVGFVRDPKLLGWDLFMRPERDNRKDSIVKKEMYEKFIKDNYEIVCIFDDRDQVVKMWREELQLDCFQVQPGSF